MNYMEKPTTITKPSYFQHPKWRHIYARVQKMRFKMNILLCKETKQTKQNKKNE